jgi:hypothetical protein
MQENGVMSPPATPIRGRGDFVAMRCIAAEHIRRDRFVLHGSRGSNA